MKKLMIAAVMTAFAAPAFAEPACEAAATPTPVWEAVKTFEEEGGVVVAFKINDGGCYEIYGTLGEAKFEVFFDPATGAEIERIEA